MNTQKRQAPKGAKPDNQNREMETGRGGGGGGGVRRG